MVIKALWRIWNGDHYLYDHHPDHLTAIDVLPNKDHDEDARTCSQLKAIQKKYSSRDRESMQKMQMETQKLYKEAGVNPWASMLPLLVQLPVMWALYQAIWRTSALRNGTFLWLQLGHPDPYYIMPILAALFTFISSWLSMASMPEKNSMTTTMTWFMRLWYSSWHWDSLQLLPYTGSNKCLPSCPNAYHSESI